MTFQDITLTPASGYSYVHCGQVYDTIAAQLLAHPSGAWTYVEYVDYVSGANTTRTHVWKCSSAASGLTADFFVLFTLRFTTAGTVYQTAYNSDAMTISLCELYNSTTKVASKYAPFANSSTSTTINSDGSHPGTWKLTAARPASQPNHTAWVYMGPLSNLTSLRFIVAVTKDVLFVAQGGTNPVWAYAGAFETTLGTTLDPLPVGLAVGGYTTNYSTFSVSGSTSHVLSSTRHPSQSGAQTYRFGFSYYSYFSPGASMDTRAGNLLSVISVGNAGGTLGDASDTGWSLWNNGVIAAKICISACGGGTGATKGGHRGYLKYMLACTLATHSFGDTFQVAGKAFVGFGSAYYGLWDTTA